MRELTSGDDFHLYGLRQGQDALIDERGGDVDDRRPSCRVTQPARLACASAGRTGQTTGRPPGRYPDASSTRTARQHVLVRWLKTFTALVAQGIEHGSPKAGVAGSNPAGGTHTPAKMHCRATYVQLDNHLYRLVRHPNSNAQVLICSPAGERRDETIWRGPTPVRRRRRAPEEPP